MLGVQGKRGKQQHYDEKSSAHEWITDKMLKYYAKPQF
jgi:hypothetical protein